MKLSRIERARAAQRIDQDRERPRPLWQLVVKSGPSRSSLERWIRHGKGGIHLDAIPDGQGGWLSTRAALRRFHQRLKAREAKRAAAAEKGGSS